MIPLSEIALRVFNRPMLLDAETAETAARLLEASFAVLARGRPAEAAEPMQPLAGKLTDRTGKKIDAAGQPAFEKVGNVAVIPIEGTLVHKGAYLSGFYGRTSYEGLTTSIRRAAADPSVRGIAFEVDSFGGEVSGAFELANLIASVSSEKPTMAILADHALSAGYLLASAARAIVMPPTGRAGSIGVVTMHADMSKLLDNIGVKITVLSAGALKADGNSFEPLGDEAAARIKTSLQRSRQTFAETVGANRGTRFDTAAALSTEAAHFDGADAVDMGLADDLGFPGEALDAFARSLNGR